MEEKTLENKQGELSAAAAGRRKAVVKKVYTPPTLTVYGKLTELTAGGSGIDGEAINPGDPRPWKKHP